MSEIRTEKLISVHKTHFWIDFLYFGDLDFIDIWPLKTELAYYVKNCTALAREYPLLFWKCADLYELQLASFDILKCSLIVKPRGHKQKKQEEMVIPFPLFVSSKPHSQAEVSL